MKISEKKLRQLIRSKLLFEILESPAPPSSHEEGLHFRMWVLDNYPGYARDNDLTSRGPHDNEIILAAWSEFGSEYTSPVSADDDIHSDQPTAVPAIVWNNVDAKPVSTALLAPLRRKIIENDWIPDFFTKPVDWLKDKIPQGHSGLIIINPDHSCYAVDFGAGPLWGCSERSWRTDFGIFTTGGTRIKELSTRADISSDGEISDDEVSRLVRLVSTSIGVSPDEWGVIDGFNSSRAMRYVENPECRPYAAIPGIYELGPVSLPSYMEGDNCGSFSFKVALAGTGLVTSLPAKLLYTLLIAPDQVIPLLSRAGVIDRTGKVS